MYKIDTQFLLLHQRTLLHQFLPPATKLWQGTVFTPVCHSLHGGGVCHTPWADTPLPSLCWDTHTPCAVHAGIRSTSGQYASYWNAFLLLLRSLIYRVDGNYVLESGLHFITKFERSKRSSEICDTSIIDIDHKEEPAMINLSAGSILPNPLPLKTSKCPYPSLGLCVATCDGGGGRERGGEWVGGWGNCIETTCNMSTTTITAATSRTALCDETASNPRSTGSKPATGFGTVIVLLFFFTGIILFCYQVNTCYL